MPSLISGRSTRMEILELLRRRQAATAETISVELGITANAVRQHLTNLEREHYVRSQPVKNKRGRPNLMFSLTERADQAFPKRYGQLATMVLTELQEMGGPEALDEVFRRIALRHSEAIEQDLQGLDFDGKLDRVVDWIARAGTLADSEDLGDGTVRVTIHNCPFRNTALKFPQVCTITPHLLHSLLGAPVAQEASIHRRDPHCSFVVERPAPPPRASRAD
jgi:predicted ArsR family transcriptional regulator